MKSLINKFVNEINIKNSRFICIILPITSDDVSSYLNSIKEEFPKANHYCYAYTFNDIYHSSDDGEPSGTAGFPILNVLQKEELINTFCCVVRYFGGIKLGAGGLVRAYTKAVCEALKISSYNEMEVGYKVNISFKYEDEKNVLSILNKCEIISKSYLETISYISLVNDDILIQLDRFSPIILEKCFIKKLN